MVPGLTFQPISGDGFLSKYDIGSELELSCKHTITHGLGPRQALGGGGECIILDFLSCSMEVINFLFFLLEDVS